VADDKDILGKADALLRRHSGAPAEADAADVPLLTDLIDAPAPAAPPADPVEREVFDRVIAEVEKRIATELERRVARSLVPQIHAAITSAVADLHQDIAKAINEALKARQVK
jgi:hypothetical protein